MATPNPLEPVKGAGTTLWVYNGKGDAYANSPGNVPRNHTSPPA